jgi:hypothetical protein
MYGPPTGDTKRLPLSDGQWILVKTRLTAGEYRDLLRRMSTQKDDGTLIVNTLETGRARCVAYLVDWSPPDWPPIRHVGADDRAQALDALDPDDFEEVKDAINGHEAAMLAERTEEKKRRTGATTSSPTSPSPAVLVGATSG